MADRRETLLAAEKAALEDAELFPTTGPFVTLDEYAVANYAAQYIIFGGSNPQAAAQAFRLDENVAVKSVQFYLRRDQSPGGNLTAKIFVATGTLGSTAVPTGAALGTSDAVAANSVSTTGELVTFTFPGLVELMANTTYCVSVEASSGDASNTIEVRIDNISSTHEGNASTQAPDGTWSAAGGHDLIFVLTGVEALTKPTGLNVYRHLSRQVDVDLLPTITVLYGGEQHTPMNLSASDVSERDISSLLVVRAKAAANESGDAALLDILQWAELALLSDYTLGGVAVNARLDRITQIDTEEHADVFAEARMEFVFSVHTKWGDPRQVP